MGLSRIDSVALLLLCVPLPPALLLLLLAVPLLLLPAFPASLAIKFPPLLRHHPALLGAVAGGAVATVLRVAVARQASKGFSFGASLLLLLLGRGFQRLFALQPLGFAPSFAPPPRGIDRGRCSKLRFTVFARLPVTLA